MKVVLKPRLLTRIMDEIGRAHAKLRSVDYIVVTDEEFKEIKSDISPGYIFEPASRPSEVPSLRTRDFPARNPRSSSPLGNVWRTACRGELFGVEVYVVPEEFHPQ